jgi:hypothetical protein
MLSEPDRGATPLYTELKLDLILETLRTLQSRIVERFPGSGLARIAADLHALGVETAPVLERAKQPDLLLRAGATLAIVLLLALGVAPLYWMRSLSFDDLAQVGTLMQAVEAATQNLIFLAIAVWFLYTIEGRLKRGAASPRCTGSGASCTSSTCTSSPRIPSTCSPLG